MDTALRGKWFTIRYLEWEGSLSSITIQPMSGYDTGLAFRVQSSEFSVEIVLLAKHGTLNYSVLRLLIGFARAALIAWKLTVNKVTTNVAMTAIKKSHQLSVVRYSYWLSQLVRKYLDSVMAIAQAISTVYTNSFDNNHSQ